MVDDLADDEQGRVRQCSPVGVGAPSLGRLDATLLLFKTAFRHHRDWGCGFAKLHQMQGNVSEPPSPHENHEGRGSVERVQEVLGQSTVLTGCGA